MKKKEYGVFGLGKFGMAVALRLAEAGNSVVAVDSDPDRIDEIANSVTCAMVADIADPDVLENLGISNLDCVVVGFPPICRPALWRRSLRKKKGCLSLFQKRKMRCTSTFWKKVGADKIVFPEAEMGGRVARNLMGGDFVDLVELSSEFSMVEMPVPEGWIGKGLRELDVRGTYGLNIIGVKHGEVLEVNMNPENPLEKEMTLVIVGKNVNLAKVGVEI